MTLGLFGCQADPGTYPCLIGFPIPLGFSNTPCRASKLPRQRLWSLEALQGVLEKPQGYWNPYTPRSLPPP